MINSIWQYRYFIFSCVKREFLMKYKGSLLGTFWSIFQPLAMIFVYTFIFSEVMKNKLAGMENIPFAYSIYLCSGLLTWGLFTETLQRCTDVFLQNANQIKKIFFPRICLPIITIFSSLINFFIGFTLFLLFLILINRFPLNAFFYFFVILLVQISFSVTIGIGLGVLNVFFRDTGQLLNVILQFWFWGTPIVYPATIIPESLKWVLKINPMYYITSGYQEVFVFNEIPNFIGIGIIFIISILIGVWSLHIYHRHIGELVDEL